MPASRPTRGVQPRAVSRFVSRSLRGVPSGLDGSKRSAPGYPTTAAIRRASSAMVTSSSAADVDPASRHRSAASRTRRHPPDRRRAGTRAAARRCPTPRPSAAPALPSPREPCASAPAARGSFAGSKLSPGPYRLVGIAEMALKPYCAPIRLAHLQARDLGDRIPLVGRLERPGQQALLRHRLRRVPRIDAARAEKQQLAAAVPVRRIDDVGLNREVVAQELRRLGAVGIECRRPWRRRGTRIAGATAAKKSSTACWRVRSSSARVAQQQRAVARRRAAAARSPSRPGRDVRPRRS